MSDLLAYVLGGGLIGGLVGGIVYLMARAAEALSGLNSRGW
jgi:hypothetical protein